MAERQTTMHLTRKSFNAISLNGPLRKKSRCRRCPASVTAPKHPLAATFSQQLRWKKKKTQRKEACPLAAGTSRPHWLRTLHKEKKTRRCGHARRRASPSRAVTGTSEPGAHGGALIYVRKLANIALAFTTSQEALTCSRSFCCSHFLVK